ncbi:MAG: Arc family DNA-binding protein [Methylococcaceae bacterium]
MIPPEKPAEDISVHIRLPVKLRDKIKTRAKTNKQTMNAELVALLERGLLDEIAAIYELKELGGRIAGLATRLEANTSDSVAGGLK